MIRKLFEQDHDVRYLGIFPYRWNWKNKFKDFWNPRERRAFPPRWFGPGWGVNFHAIWGKVTGRAK